MIKNCYFFIDIYDENLFKPHKANVNVTLEYNDA